MAKKEGLSDVSPRLVKAGSQIGEMVGALTRAALESTDPGATEFLMEQAATARKLKDTCLTSGLDEKQVDRLVRRRLVDMENGLGVFSGDIREADRFIETIHKIREGHFPGAAGPGPVADLLPGSVPVASPAVREPSRPKTEPPAPKASDTIGDRLKHLATQLEAAGTRSYDNNNVAAACREKAEQVRDQLGRLEAGQSLDVVAPHLRRTLDGVRMALGDKSELDPGLRQMIGITDSKGVVETYGTVSGVLEEQCKLHGKKDHGQLKVTGGMQRMGKALSTLSSAFEEAREKDPGHIQLYERAWVKTEKLASLCLTHSTDCETQSATQVKRELRELAIEFNHLKVNHVVSSPEFLRLNGAVQKIAIQSGAISGPILTA